MVGWTDQVNIRNNVKLLTSLELIIIIITKFVSGWMVGWTWPLVQTFHHNELLLTIVTPYIVDDSICVINWEAICFTLRSSGMLRSEVSSIVFIAPSE